MDIGTERSFPIGGNSRGKGPEAARIGPQRGTEGRVT